MSNLQSKYEWEWDNDYTSRTTTVVTDGIPVIIKLIHEDDPNFGLDYVMESYEYIKYEENYYLDMTDLDDVDDALKHGDISDAQHMQAHAGGYYKISLGRHTKPWLVDIWASVRDYQRDINPDMPFNKAFTEIMETIDLIEGFLHGDWHFMYISGYVKGREDDTTDLMGGYESYLFEAGENAKYGDRIIEDFATERVFEYKTKGNWRQGLLDID